MWLGGVYVSFLLIIFRPRLSERVASRRPVATAPRSRMWEVVIEEEFDAIKMREMAGGGRHKRPNRTRTPPQPAAHALLCLTACGLCFWLGIEGVVLLAESKYATGADGNQLTGLELGGAVAMCFALPIAVFLLLHVQGLLLASRSIPVWFKLGAFAKGLGAALYGCYASARLGEDLLSCGIIGCVGADPGRSGDWTGLRGALGVSLFLAALLLATAQLWLLWATWRQRRDLHADSNDMSRPGPGLLSTTPVNQFLNDRRRVRRRHAFSALAAFLVLFPLCWALTTVLPPSWTGLTAASIARNAKNANLIDFSRCVDPFQSDNCPEYKGAAMFSTIKVAYSPGRYANLHPDVAMYYGFLYVVALIGLVAQIHAPSRRMLAQRVRCPCRRHAYVTVGATVVGLMLSALLCFFVYYWSVERWIVPAKQFSRGVAARTLGQLAGLLLALLLLPVSRNSIWTAAFGVPHEAMLAIHTWLGGAFLACGVIHMVMWWLVWSDMNTFPHDTIAPAPYWPSQRRPGVPPSGTNWTISLATAGLAALALMCALAAWRVRRANYELFYVSHHVAICCVLVTLLHATASWYYVIGSLALWVTDRALRFVGSQTACSVRSLRRVAPGVVELRLKKPHGEVLNDIGQYIFINVPAVSLVEWHPFTISSSPLDSDISLHIKSMGDNTWSGRLLALAATHPGGINTAVAAKPCSYARLSPGRQLRVRVDGPYGVPIRHDRYRRILLCAGGIGVTPCHAIFRTLYQLTRAGRCRVELVKLIWVVRKTVEFDLFRETLLAAQRDSLGGRFQFLLFATESGPGRGRGRSDLEDAPPMRRSVAEGKEGLRFFRERPNWALDGLPWDSEDDSDSEDGSEGDSSSDNLSRSASSDSERHESRRRRQRPRLSTRVSAHTAASTCTTATDTVGSADGAPSEVQDNDERREELVFACGPPALVRETSCVAFNRGSDFRSEAFEW